MPSSPLPAAAARGPRRLHPPPARSPAGPPGPRRPTPSRADGALGGGEEEEGATPSRAGRSTGPPRLRLLLLPHTPSRPCLPAGDLGRRRRRTDRAGDNCQLEAPLGGWGGEGRGGEERGRALSPPGRGELGRAAKKEAPSPFPARMRSGTRWPRPLSATPKPGLGSSAGPEAECGGGPMMSSICGLGRGVGWREKQSACAGARS